MPTEKPKILLTLEDDLLARIEDFRFGNRIPSRSEAIRRLIEERTADEDLQKAIYDALLPLVLGGRQEEKEPVRHDNESR